MSDHVDLETLSAFVDRALAANEASAVQAHVGGCDACRARVTKLEALSAVLARDADVEPSAGFDARVMAAVAKERGGFWRAWWRPRVLAPAAAAALAVAVGVVVLLPGPPSEDDLFIAQNQEMLAELDMLKDYDAVETAGDDFAVIASLGEIAPEQGGE